MSSNLVDFILGSLVACDRNIYHCLVIYNCEEITILKNLLSLDFIMA